MKDELAERRRRRTVEAAGAPYFDDLALNDSSSTGSWPGGGSVVTIDGVEYRDAQIVTAELSFVEHFSPEVEALAAKFDDMARWARDASRSTGSAPPLTEAALARFYAGVVGKRHLRPVDDEPPPAA